VFGLIFAVISIIVHTLAAFLEMSYYLNPSYFAVWSSIMMSTAGPPGVIFYVLSFLFAFISGVIFAWVFTVIKRGIQFKGIVRGLFYAMLIFLIVAVQGILSNDFIGCSSSNAGPVLGNRKPGDLCDCRSNTRKDV